MDGFRLQPVLFLGRFHRLFRQLEKFAREFDVVECCLRAHESLVEAFLAQAEAIESVGIFQRKVHEARIGLCVIGGEFQNRAFALDGLNAVVIVSASSFEKCPST